MSDYPKNDVIFLLGAGASVPAGLPDIDLMTHTFVESLGKKHLEVVEFLQKRIERPERKFDIELLLEAITNITRESESVVTTLYDTPAPELDTYKDRFPELTRLVKEHIRRSCNQFGNIDYLFHLLSFAEPEFGNHLDIFTLNYDATLEVICELKNVRWTDGFDPFWDPLNLERLDSGVRIWKMHGSLFWFETPGNRYVKLPIRVVKPEELNYWNGDKLKDVTIYPTLSKNTESGPFPTISSWFRRRLAEASLCIIIGYSFRDDYIKNLLIKGMTDNPNLWLLIASPHASTYLSSRFFASARFLEARVLTLDANAKELLGSHRLYPTVETLLMARQNERTAFHEQEKRPDREDHYWGLAIDAYKELGFYSRCRYLLRYLYDNYPAGLYYNAIEPRTYGLCLRFGIDAILSEDNLEARKWLEKFLEGCTFVEYKDSGSSADAGILPPWSDQVDHKYVVRDLEGDATSLLSNHELTKNLELRKRVRKIADVAKAISMGNLDPNDKNSLTTEASWFLSQAT